MERANTPMTTHVVTFATCSKRQIGRRRLQSFELQGTVEFRPSNTRKYSTSKTATSRPQLTLKTPLTPINCTYSITHCPASELRIKNEPTPIPELEPSAEAGSLNTDNTTEHTSVEEDKEGGGGQGREGMEIGPKLSSQSDRALQRVLVEYECSRWGPQPRKKSQSDTFTSARSYASSIQTSKSPAPFKSGQRVREISCVFLKTAEDRSNMSRPAALRAYKDFLVSLFESLCFIRQMCELKESNFLAHRQTIPRVLAGPSTQYSIILRRNQDSGIRSR